MDWQMANSDRLGKVVEISALTANYTSKDWMDSWDSISYVAESKIKIEIVQEQSWDGAIERVLRERREAWEILSNL